jgi:hypothetical protein
MILSFFLGRMTSSPAIFLPHCVQAAGGCQEHLNTDSAHLEGSISILFYHGEGWLPKTPF